MYPAASQLAVHQHWAAEVARLWPEADDLATDLDRHRGPDWLDQTAARVRARLAGVRLAAVVGHGDWESQNIRWRGRRPLVVHDWDSVVAQPEAAIAGQAAAVWPALQRARAEPVSSMTASTPPPSSLRSSTLGGLAGVASPWRGWRRRCERGQDVAEAAIRLAGAGGWR